MRQKRETPEPWRGAMERAGIDSLQQLSIRAGVAVETLARLVHGEGTTSDRVIKAVEAQFTAVDRKHVAEWAGKLRTMPEPVLPDGARALTPKQWRAVEAVISSMVDPGRGVQDEQEPTRLRAVAKKRPNNPPTRP